MDLIDKIKMAQVSAGEQAVIDNLKEIGFLDTPEKVWTLISPEGKKFKAESPLKCCREEVASRVPLETRIERLTTAMDLCFLCGEDKINFTLAKGTPAEIGVCLTCKNTIVASFGKESQTI